MKEALDKAVISSADEANNRNEPTVRNRAFLPKNINDVSADDLIEIVGISVREMLSASLKVCGGECEDRTAACDEEGECVDDRMMPIALIVELDGDQVVGADLSVSNYFCCDNPEWVVLAGIEKALRRNRKGANKPAEVVIHETIHEGIIRLRQMREEYRQEQLLAKFEEDIHKSWPSVTEDTTVGSFLREQPNGRAILVIDDEGSVLVALASNRFDTDLAYFTAADHQHDQIVSAFGRVLPLLARALRIGESRKSVPPVDRPERLW